VLLAMAIAEHGKPLTKERDGNFTITVLSKHDWYGMHGCS
jgi:hypothetical protein